VAQRIMRVMGPVFLFDQKHIYPVLARMVRDNLAVIDGQKIYSPTKKTEAEWQKWLMSPPELTVVREDIQVRLAFAQEKDAPELLRVLTEYQRTLLAVIDENVIDAPGRSWKGRKVRWIRAGVDQRLNAEHQWVTSICNELREFIADRRLG
jgi:DNA-binding PadR family transcriptional regulator